MAKKNQRAVKAQRKLAKLHKAKDLLQKKTEKKVEAIGKQIKRAEEKLSIALKKYGPLPEKKSDKKAAKKGVAKKAAKKQVAKKAAPKKAAAKKSTQHAKSEASE